MGQRLFPSLTKRCWHDRTILERSAGQSPGGRASGSVRTTMQQLRQGRGHRDTTGIGRAFPVMLRDRGGARLHYDALLPQRLNAPTSLRPTNYPIIATLRMRYMPLVARRDCWLG
jgi:hypothetical protein